MAIRDLLWACPICGELRGLRAEREGERCERCGTVYRRDGRATIVATQGDRVTVREAAEWVDLLPDASSLAACGADGTTADGVEANFAVGTTPIRHGGEYLGRVEQFGAVQQGTLSLDGARLLFRARSGEETAWPLERITAVQASSRTLQIKARDERVVSFRFPDDSLRFWEERIQQTLRRFYRRSGRGEIREFQPRIVVR